LDIDPHNYMVQDGLNVSMYTNNSHDGYITLSVTFVSCKLQQLAEEIDKNILIKITIDITKRTDLLSSAACCECK